ncbi:MAG: hypothetical protein BroJett025_01880 [Patescibacteria group bacterium]|nr:MAG: hypothetical protein BroJett025_01880 [Patescibacteria group bacterium]
MLDKKTLQTQLQQLIAIRSLSGQIPENSAVLDLIETLVNPQATVKRIKNKSAEILLISNIQNATDEQLMNPEFGYLVHVDVVAAKEELWTMKLGERTIREKSNTETVALGRGVSDMKYSVPIGVSILNDLIKQKSNKTITLAITTDEERGGFDGALYLAENLKFRPQNLIVPDGGDNWKFVNKAKGILHIRVSCKGRAAHGSRPWQGKNAISLLVKMLSKLLEKYEQNSFEPNWGTTMSPGVIKGGVSVNQVCDGALVEIDFRYPETTSIENIVNEVKEIATSVGAEVTVETMASGLATYTNVDLPIVQKFVSTMQKHTHSTIEIVPNYGGSDARHFASYNIPVLMMKPTGGDIHEDTEWISLDSCLEYERGLFEFITQ